MCIGQTASRQIKEIQTIKTRDSNTTQTTSSPSPREVKQSVKVAIVHLCLFGKELTSVSPQCQSGDDLPPLLRRCINFILSCEEKKNPEKTRKKKASAAQTACEAAPGTPSNCEASLNEEKHMFIIFTTIIRAARRGLSRLFNLLCSAERKCGGVV